MFIPFGELGLGKLSENDKKSFVSFLKGNIGSDENIESVSSAQVVRKGLDWNMVNDTASTATIIGIMYKAGKATPKGLRSFFELAKMWANKNKVEYDEKEIEAWVEFMETKTLPEKEEK